MAEHAVEIYKKFRNVENQLRYIRSMYENSTYINNKKDMKLSELTAKQAGFHEAVEELVDFAKELLTAVNLSDDSLESDENMDPEKTKIPPLKGYFDNTVVENYIQSRIEEAAERSKAKEENFNKGICATKCTPSTCACEVDKSQPEEEEGEYLDYMFDGLCYEQFLDKIQEMGYTLDTVPVTGGFLAGVVVNKDYCKTCNCLNECATAEEPLKVFSMKMDGFEMEGYTDGVAFKQNKSENLLEYVTNVSNMVSFQVNSTLDFIEESYANVKEFTEDDIEVLRFYLSSLPANSKHEIDELSDKGIVLAFKRRILHLKK